VRAFVSGGGASGPDVEGAAWDVAAAAAPAAAGPSRAGSLKRMRTSDGFEGLGKILKRD